MDKNTGYVALSEVNPENILSWTTGIYSFEDMPLEQITDRLEKYGVTIIISDEKVVRKIYRQILCTTTY